MDATEVLATHLPTHVATALDALRRLTALERLTLAKLLLESVLADEWSEQAAWTALGLSSFERDWDNDEDAIYDNWREHYGVPAR